MNARERRRAIMGVLERAKDPVSGSALAREVGVSRQVVVQDIALLRADGHDIVATNRGYVLQEAASSPAVPTRLVKVRHSVEQAGDELTSIVDAGGAVLNVIVNHRVYGKITGDLDIRDMYWLNIDPTTAGWVLKAGMGGLGDAAVAPVPYEDETVG